MPPHGDRTLRIEVVFPGDDPRFADLVAYLHALKAQGRRSKAAQAVRELALVGWVWQQGGAAPAAGNAAAAPTVAALPVSPDDIRAAHANLRGALQDLFDDLDG